MKNRLLLFILLPMFTLQGQGLSHALTQRGGDNNALFLNPAKLMNKTKKQEINVLNSSVALDKKSFDFLKTLNTASSNQELSKLLNKNIGNNLNFSASNFSSFYQNKENWAYSIGLASVTQGYFITHSGFGSKRAMESRIDAYQALVSTFAFKEKNFSYGLNIKIMQKAETLHNYSLSEMIENNSISDYFNNEYSKKESALGMDMGLLYELPQDAFHTQFSLGFLNIGDTSFQELEKVESSTTIGFSIEPKKTKIQIDYIEDNLRLDFSQKFFNKHLELHTGLNYKALSVGFNYQYSFFNIGFYSYKTEIYNQPTQRKYELSMTLLW